MPPFSLVLYQSASRQTTARRLSTTLPLRQSLFTHSRKPLLQIHSQFIPRNWLCFCWFHLANGPCINLPFKRSYNFYFTIILFNKYLLVGPLRVEMLFSFSERETALFLVNSRRNKAFVSDLFTVSVHSFHRLYRLLLEPSWIPW